MATRGLIGRTTVRGFEARYHHWDSYPSGLGATLYNLYNGHFQKDIRSMMHVLIDEHKAGWSSINDADFSKSPGFVDHGASESDRPHCYCHGDRHEKPSSLITMRSDNWGAEYAYAIDEATCVMSIYRWRTNAWQHFKDIDLNGSEPDWEKLDS